MTRCAATGPNGGCWAVLQAEEVYTALVEVVANACDGASPRADVLAAIVIATLVTA